MAQVHNMKGGHFTTATPVHEIANELLGKICAVMPMPELFYFATSSKALYLSCKTYLEEPLKLRGMYLHTRPGASRTIRQHYYWNTEKDIYDSIDNARHLFSSLPPRPQWYDRDLPDGDPAHFPDKVDPARTLWNLSLSDARAHLSTMSDDDKRRRSEDFAP